MLFLLNTVIVKTQLTLELPAGLEELGEAPPGSVLSAGRELFATYPRLEYDQPETARWYCTLLQLKFPEAGGACFYPSGMGYAGELAAIALPDLVRLWTLQESGVDIGPEIRETVWPGDRLPPRLPSSRPDSRCCSRWPAGCAWPTSTSPSR